MKTAKLPKRFLTRRDKSGHRRGRSADGVQKVGPPSPLRFDSTIPS